MNVIEGSVLVIAICHVLWVVGAGIAVFRLRSLAKRSAPIVANAMLTAEHVSRISKNLEDMSATARHLEERVADTAELVMDEIEPPIRTLAAVLAGVRAGINKLFESNSRHRTNGAVEHSSMRD
jgi:hypothetical protein